MITVGSTVRVTRLPENNGYWGIPTELVSAVGVVTNIETGGDDGGRIYVTIGRDEWYFPYSQIGVLVPNNDCKWNKMGYISPFKPLNLP